MKYIILLSLIFSSLVFAEEINVSSGDKITANLVNSIHLPDYDSGWIPADSITNNVIDLQHNFGDLPSRANVYIAVDKDITTTGTPINQDIIRMSPLSTIKTNMSPEAVNLTNTHAYVVFYSGDDFLYCDVNARCHLQDGTLWTSGGSYKKGFVRLKLWK